MSISDRQAQENEAKKQMKKGIIQMIVMDIVLPMVIIAVLQGKVSLVLALVLSGIPPALEGIQNIYKTKQIDAIGAMVIISIIFSITVVLLTNDPKLILLKDSFQTVFLAILFGTSLFMEENLIWRYNRQFSGHHPDTQRELDEKWKNPQVKSTTNTLCIIWAIGLLMEACIRIVLIYTIPTDIFAYFSNALLFVVLGLLSIFTMVFVMNARKKYAASNPINP
ncbi:hypothetical protein HK103_000893 [Boothiomyces macroporosus]|uniref:Uncharacterized protein n=1 Tax=Boothiomyces macroporosus TaxID=261099 RepID=A0AAD5Y598_9FUNG|nr:hypothetical protein HK103_000893 [Boothiomyces macroporosus]